MRSLNNIKTNKTMRKLFFILCMAICSVCLTSCGDDDKGSSSGGSSSGGGSSTDGSGSTIVDGVHVNPRKLLTLDLYNQDKSDNSIHFAMSYDSKGRLSKIKMTNGELTTELVDIDYDLKVLSCYFDINGPYRYSYGTESLPYRFPFSLNKYGFISRISNCEFSYNDAGYLTDVNAVEDVWTFAYSEGEIIKYMAETLKTGNVLIYYAYYGEKDGELYFTVNSTNKSYKRNSWSLRDWRTVSSLILYHAGLFGNISKHSQNLSAYSNKGAVIEQSNSNNKVTVHCSFKIE